MDNSRQVLFCYISFSLHIFNVWMNLLACGSSNASVGGSATRNLASLLVKLDTPSPEALKAAKPLSGGCWLGRGGKGS
jgi:hypothetical protein